MKKLLGVLLLMMMGLAALAYWLSVPGAPQAEQGFRLASAERGDLEETVSATGVLQPDEVIPVGTELAGKVVEVAADFNQIVEEGQLLIRLDDDAALRRLRQAEVAVEMARADVKRALSTQSAAEKTVDRLRNLPPDVGLRKDLDAAEAQLEAARAGVEVAQARVKEAEEAEKLAEHNLQLTRVHVPVIRRPSESDSPQGNVGTLLPSEKLQHPRKTYIVLERRVKLNQQIGPPASGHLFTLAGDLRRMQVYAQVAEGDIGRVRRDQEAKFSVATYDEDITFQGRVSDLRLLPTNEKGAIFYEVVIDVANVRDPSTGDWQLRPGMTASVDVLVRRHGDVWKVPLSALNLEIPEEQINAAARARLEEWRASPTRDKWAPVWVPGEDGQPSPILVRVGGTDPRGELGIRDVHHVEVLEWDPNLTPSPDPRAPQTYPQLILGVPATSRGGLFKLPKIKM